MSTLTAILIDDEISNLKGLEQKLAKLFPEIEIQRSFQKPEDAITYLQKQQPDVVFLDIEMPRINGFDLLAQLSVIHFHVIFVTAYSEYAIEAFKQNAVDYILKPIDNKDLESAVQKVLALIGSNNAQFNSQQLADLLSETITTKKIIIPTTKGMSFIPQEEVLHFEGYEGYTKIHLVDGSLLTSSYNLGRFEKVLSAIFFKTHKSHIVNMEKVRHFENEGYLVLDNKSRVPISRANKKLFLDQFN